MKKILPQLQKIRTHPVIVVSLLNAAVALAAFFKDIVLAMYLGTSVQADAFNLAYFVPDTLGNSLIASAIATVSIPVFSKLVVLSRGAVLSMTVKRLLLQTGLLAGAVYIVCLLLSSEISRWLGGGDERLTALMVPLLSILLPIIVIYPLTMIGAAVHQTYHRFVMPMLVPGVINITVLFALIAAIAAGYSKQAGIHAASWATLAAMAAAGILTWTTLKGVAGAGGDEIESGARPANGSEAHNPSQTRKIWKGFFIYMLFLFSTQAVYIAERYMAARTETGAVAALNYAFRLSQFPVWVFVSAFATVILPRMARQYALGQAADLSETLLKTMRNILLVTVPLSLLLWIFREPVTALLFQRGAFDGRSVALTSAVLGGYAWSIVFQSASLVALRFFLAAEELTAPVVIMLVCSAGTIGLDFQLVRRFGVSGLGYGAAAGALLTAMLLLGLLQKRMDLRALMKLAFMLLAANVPPAILVLIVSIWIWPAGGMRGFLPLFVYLAVNTVVYGLIFLGMAKSLKLLHTTKGAFL